MHAYKNTQWFSIIASVMLIWFLLVLTASTLNLVLQEMQDGRGRQLYLKSFSAAEWSLEIALLQLKQYGYWYDEDTFQDKKLFWNDSYDSVVWYEFENKTQAFSSSLGGFETVFIPLFWTDESDSYSIDDIAVITPSSNIVWNIVGQSDGLSWRWSFDTAYSSENKVTTDVSWDVIVSSNSVSVWDFLSNNNQSYLILYNSSDSQVNYEVSSNDSFSRPVTEIISSWNVWKYSQNLSTEVDNTEFLWILKYSIYSWQ